MTMRSKRKGFTLWFTGLPCSGKTTLADEMKRCLSDLGHRVERLDGDAIRKSLSSDLGFSKDHRRINIERAAFVAGLLTKGGVATLVSFVSPYREIRDSARRHIGSFVEVFVNCPLWVCEKRDVKGMYKLAREGKISDFTGVSDPYEAPLNPEVTVDTDRMSVQECAIEILRYLNSQGLLLPENPFPGDPELTKAFRLAAHHHWGQERKGGSPYIVHPVAVARMLKDSGCDKETVAAGLLHDVLEDTGCEVEEITREMGRKVARIVCEITDKDKTVGWKARKKNYLAGLKKASRPALCVTSADKTDNITSLLEGYRSVGKYFFKSFSGKFREKYANYKKIYHMIQSRYPSCPLLPFYRTRLAEMKDLLDKVVKKA